MCPGLGDLTPSSSPHNVGKDPRSLSLKRCPLQGLQLGEAGVFRLGLLSVYVLRAYDLDRWAAVPPLGLPTPCEKWGWLGLVIPFYATPPAWNRLGTGRQAGQTELSAPLQPQPGAGREICSQEPSPCGPERYPSLCWLCGRRSQALQVCQPTVGGPVCLPLWAGSACQPHLGTPHPHAHPERRARRVLLS